MCALMCAPAPSLRAHACVDVRAFMCALATSFRIYTRGYAYILTLGFVIRKSMFGVAFLACLRENGGTITASKIMQNSLAIHAPSPAHIRPTSLATNTRSFLLEHKILQATPITRYLLQDHKILHQKFMQYGANAKEWMRKCVLLLPEIEKHRIWEKKGFGSIYEYAAKLAGMSRNTVDDAMRILRKIENEPALQKVVEQKGLNSVRPVVAIATPETAGFWAEKAMLMSRHTLETYVKEVSRAHILDDVAKDISRTGTGNITGNPHLEAVLNLGSEWRAAESRAPQKTVVMQLDSEVA